MWQGDILISRMFVVFVFLSTRNAEAMRQKCRTTAQNVKAIYGHRLFFIFGLYFLVSTFELCSEAGKMVAEAALTCWACLKASMNIIKKYECIAEEDEPTP